MVKKHLLHKKKLTALFKDVKQWHALKLVGAESLKSGKVSLIYKCGILINQEQPVTHFRSVQP